MFMLLLCLCLPLAMANEFLLRVVVDTQQNDTLVEPVIVVAKKTVPLMDNGWIAGDQPNDKVYITSLFLESRQNIAIELLQQSQTMGKVVLSTLKPGQDTVFLALDRGVLITTEGKREFPALEQSFTLKASPLVDRKPTNKEAMLLQMEIDDSKLKLLESPTLRLQNARASDPETISIKKDSTGAWVGAIELNRRERVILALEDRGIGIGAISIALPATPAIKGKVYVVAGGISKFSGGKKESQVALTTRAIPVSGPGPVAKEGKPQIELMLELDLRNMPNKSKPLLLWQDKSFPLLDDGRLSIDQPGDSLYCVQLIVPQQDSILLRLSLADYELGRMTTFLPRTSRARMRLQASQQGLTVISQHYQKMEKYAVKATGLKVDKPKQTPSPKLSVLLSIVPHLALQKPQLVINGEVKELGQKLTTDFQLVESIAIQKQGAVYVELIDKGKKLAEKWVLIPDLQESVVALQVTKDGFDVPSSFQYQSQTLPFYRVPLYDAKPIETVGFNKRVKLKVVVTDLLGDVKNLQIQLEGREKIDFSRNKQGEYVWLTEIPHKPYIILPIFNGTQLLGRLVVMLPKAKTAELTLRYDRFGLQLPNSSPVTKPLVFEAESSRQSQSKSDEISVKMLLSDRILQKLNKPVLRFALENMQPVAFRDDGKNGDEIADDDIYTVSFQVGREEYLKISVEDGGQSVGQMTVFLPSSDKVMIRLRTTTEEEGLRLLTEPQAMSKVDAPNQVAGELQPRTDLVAHVIWAMVLLFAVAFAYVRYAVYQHWSQEVQPLLAQLKEFLEAEKNKEKVDET